MPIPFDPSLTFALSVSASPGAAETAAFVRALVTRGEFEAAVDQERDADSLDGSSRIAQ